jgi:hypothetical protein
MASTASGIETTAANKHPSSECFTGGGQLRRSAAGCLPLLGKHSTDRAIRFRPTATPADGRTSISAVLASRSPRHREQQYVTSHSFHPLARVSIRLLLGLAGLSFIAVGIVAVFETDNGAGSAALLTVGAGLVLLALLGPTLTSIKLPSGLEAELATAETLQTEADAARAKGDEEAAATLERSVQLLRDELRYTIRGLQSAWDADLPDPRVLYREYEKSVGEALREISPTPNTVAFHEEVFNASTSARGYWDIVLWFSHHRIGVEVRSGAAFDPARAARQVMSSVEPSRVSGVIVVVNTGASDQNLAALRNGLSELRQAASRPEPIEVVAWRISEPTGPLEQAVSRIIAEGPARPISVGPAHFDHEHPAAAGDPHRRENGDQDPA